MKTKRKTPDIRFRGFSDDWEQRKLKNVVSFSKGKWYSKGDINEKGTPIILYGSLYTDYKYNIDDVKTFANQKDNSVISKGSEVIIPSSGETSEDIARASAVTQENVILAGDLNVLEPNKDIDNIFLAMNLSNGNSKRQLIKRAQGKSVVHLYNSDIESVKLLIPTKKEQDHITELILGFNHTITLHQRKLQQLKEVKRGMLEKMFCKRKSEIPELRFLDFKEQWSCAKLENLSTITTGKLNANAATENGLYRFYTTSKDFFHTDSYSFDGDAILINGNGDLGFTRMYSGKFDAYQRTYVLMDFKEEYVFLYYSIINELPKKIHAEAIGGAMPYIKLETISDLRLKIPIKSEQIEIGLFLGKLDRLIELQEREIELLEETKKGFLQKMFV